MQCRRQGGEAGEGILRQEASHVRIVEAGAQENQADNVVLFTGEAKSIGGLLGVH